MQSRKCRKTPGHRGICEYYLGEKVLQILLQIRAYQNSVPELRNPNIRTKNTITSCSWIGTWVALGLGSHILLKHAIHKNNSDVSLPWRYQKSAQMHAQVIQTVTLLCMQLWKAGPKDFLHLFSLCTRIAEVLSEVLSPPQVIVKLKEAAGAPCHWKSRHWLNHQQSLITKTCSWYSMKSEIAVRVLSN